MTMVSQLEAALRRGREPGHDLADELLTLREATVETVGEAEAICDALAHLLEAANPRPCGAGGTPEPPPEVPATALRMLASLFQRVKSAAAFQQLHDVGIPRLLDLYGLRIHAGGDDRDDLPFLLKLFALYRHPDGFQAILSAIRQGWFADDFLWGVIFQAFGPEHPQREALIAALRDPLPQGFCAVAFLDHCNALALQGLLAEHPFAGEAGRSRLEGWLRDPAPERVSYAHSATAALPFVPRPERDALLALALDHAHPRVQLEAAWASAKLGSRGGLEMLQRACLEPATSRIACAYLSELGHDDDIPEAAQDPDLQAQSELALWLAHPQEIGRPPDALRVVDRRTLWWPPTRDERPLWLIEYRYDDLDGAERRGVGCVGSVTFALFGEATVERTPDELYALYCCWELKARHDPRAPAERSVAAGRALLEAGPQGE